MARKKLFIKQADAMREAQEKAAFKRRKAEMVELQKKAKRAEETKMEELYAT